MRLEIVKGNVDQKPLKFFDMFLETDGGHI